MTNVCLLVKNRPRLTEQTLLSLYANTPHDQFNLTIVNDGSDTKTVTVLASYVARSNCRIISVSSIGIVGFLRNVGASASERYFGRGEWLCFIDNDIAFMPNWLQKMIYTMRYSAANQIANVVVLGGYRHPFHGVNYESQVWQETDAVAGYMHFMRWETWDKYGPYDQHAKGVCQSEDFAFCQKIIKDGGRVGYIHPPVIANCGITNSEGKPAVGSEQFPRIPGLIYE